MDTSDSLRPLGGGHPNDGKMSRKASVSLTVSVSVHSAFRTKALSDVHKIKKFKKRQVTYRWDCDSQVHHDLWFCAGAQWVAADQIDRSRRCHVELAFCRFGHQEERDLNSTRQP